MLAIQNIGAVSVIQARSSLVGECLDQCKQAVDDCLGNRRLWLILELSDCPTINSEGLEFIVETQQRCLGRGGRLLVAGPQQLSKEVMHITGVDEDVSVFDDLRSALADFSR
ncbi:MAG: STAS domain-containing protein [Planctomycetales bacterium]|nr:STAS domain-containing protein [Planctomycetales bacterium]